MVNLGTERFTYSSSSQSIGSRYGEGKRYSYVNNRHRTSHTISKDELVPKEIDVLKAGLTKT